jgi:hypothetical protein
VLISPSIQCRASDCPRRARGGFWIHQHIRPASATLHEESNCENYDYHYHDGFNYCCQRHWSSPLLLRAELSPSSAASAVTMGRCAGLSCAEFALLSGPSSTRRTMDSKYPFWSEVFIHDRRMGSRESADLGFSVHLRKSVPQSNHVTPRRFGGSTARVLATFCEVHFEQKLALLFYPYYCPWAQVL